MPLDHGQSSRLTSGSMDHPRSTPQVTAQVMPTLPRSQKLSSPHLSGTEAATSIGGNTATGTSPDGLPEQTIFPGIVHETVRRGSMRAQGTCDE